MTTLSPDLLAILACPEDKGPLHYLADEAWLYNVRSHRRYAVRDGIPVMLVEESEVVDDAEHERLLALITETRDRTDLHRERLTGAAALLKVRCAGAEEPV